MWVNLGVSVHLGVVSFWGLSIWGCVHLVGVVNVCVGPSEVTLGDGCACVCVHLGVRPSGGGVHLGVAIWVCVHLGVVSIWGDIHLGVCPSGWC